MAPPRPPPPPPAHPRRPERGCRLGEPGRPPPGPPARRRPSCRAASTGYPGRFGNSPSLSCAPLLPPFYEPPAMSSTRSRVSPCRWPVLRRYFFRRLNLKTVILGPRTWPTIVARTFAPATTGAPKVTFSPVPTSSTRGSSTPSPPSRVLHSHMIF